MPPHLSKFEKQQLDVIARVTPHAMLGHILNTSVLAVAVAGSIPTVHLAIWCTYSYAVALLLLYRHARSRGRVPRSFRRAALRAEVYGLLLALPWSSMAVLHLGGLGHDQELVLVALGVGMAASGTILLSAVPLAAFSYMSGILLPAAVKCLFFLNQKGYVFLGVLAVSYWWFLAALIAKIAREIGERKQADLALKESEVRLQEALTAGQVVAFTWDPGTGLSRRSANAPEVLGLASRVDPGGRPSDFLERVHPDDRACFAAQVKALSPENPSYSASFRLVTAGARGVAGGDGEGRVRCGRALSAPQGADARHHRAHARRGAAAPAGPRA
jgi:PAS domain-containing protein